MKDFLAVIVELRLIARVCCLLQILALLCLSLPPAGFALDRAPLSAQTRSESGPQQFTLPNGLKIVLLEDHSFPVVSCLVWYKVGARNESPGATGLSHIVEHLLFQTVGHYRKGELGATIVRNGGQFNGFTSDDFTAFFETIHPSKLELALRIESERMRGATFTQSDLQDEVNRVNAEFDRDAKDTSAALGREVRAAAYMRHPYRNPTVGWRTDLESITLRDAKEFYDRYYHPNNATLVIVGDCRTQPTIAAAVKYFGAIPKSVNAIPAVRVTEPPQSAERRVLLHYAGKKDEVQLAYHGPSFADSDAPAMIVLEKLLNASISGKLKLKMLDPKVCNYGKSAFELKRDPGLFTVSLSAPAGTGPQKVLEGWDALVAQLRTQPITENELRRARNQAEFAMVCDCDGPYRMGFQLGFCDMLQSWQSSAAWTTRLRAVSASDVLRVTKKYLAPENRVVGLLASNSNKPASPSNNNIPAKPPTKPTPVTSPLLRTPISRNFEHTKLLGYKDDDGAVVKISAASGTAGGANSGTAQPAAAAGRDAAASDDSAAGNDSPAGSTSAASNAAPAGKESAAANTPAASPASAASETNALPEGESKWRHRLRRFMAPPPAGIPNPASVPRHPQFNMRILPPEQAAPASEDNASGAASAAPAATPAVTPAATSSSTSSSGPAQTPAAPSSAPPSGTAAGSAALPERAAEARATESDENSTESASGTSTSLTPAPAAAASAATNAKAATESASTTSSVATPAGATSPGATSTIAAPPVAAPNRSSSNVQKPTDNRQQAVSETTAKTVAASLPLIQRKVLKNGTVVIVVESHLAPLVQVNGAIKAGDVFDAAGKKGLSELCTHILNNGPSRTGRAQSLQQQEDLGLQPQAMLRFECSPETVNFQTRCLSRDLAVQLNLLGAAIKDPPLQDADVEKARTEYYSAMKNAEESVTLRINRALLRSVIAPNTSYYPVDPSEKARQVSQLKAADIKDFLSQYLTPDAAVIVIAGDVSPDRAFALVERAFDGWSGQAGGKASRTFPPATESPRKLLKASIPFSSASDKGKTTVSVGRLMKVQSDEKDYSILLVSDCALSNHPLFSRLVQRMNNEPGLAEGLSFEDMESRFLPLSNMISWSLIVPVEPNLVSRTTAAIQAELKRFTRTGITDNELNEVKRYMSAALPVRLMPSTAEAAKCTLNGYFQGIDSNFLGQLIGSIRAVDLDSVNKFIKNEFRPDQGVLIVAGSPDVIKQVRVSSASRTKGGVDAETPPAAP